MTKTGRAWALLFMGLVLGAAASFAEPKTPAAQGAIKSASYIVRLSSAPTQPVRGLDILEAYVTDASGRPVEGAQVSFDLNMTNMNHGKNVVTAAAQGGGRYSGRVRFMMPGPWRVIVRVAEPGRPPEDLRFEFNVNLF